MSKNIQKEEKVEGNCIDCNFLKEEMQKLPCGHSICNECLCLSLIDLEFNHSNISQGITFYCPECFPIYKAIEKTPSITISYSELNNIFSNSSKNNSPLKCIKHPKEDLKYFCETCNNELCEECKNNDTEHEDSQIEVEELRADYAEKLIENQRLTMEEITDKIQENKQKIKSVINQSIELIKGKIFQIIDDLTKFVEEIEEKGKEKEKNIIDFFEMMIFTYEKYYSMINSPRLTLQNLNDISNMKKIIDINICQNNEISEKLNKLNSYIIEQNNELKNILPLKVDIIYEEGIVQTKNCNSIKTEHKQFMTGGLLIKNGNNLVTASTDNSLIIYEKQKKDDLISFNKIKKIIDTKLIATSLSNLVADYFVVGYDTGLIKVWRTEDFEVDRIYTGHSSQVRKIIKETDNSFISCSDDMTIRGWSLENIEADCSYILTGHEDLINDILLYDENNLISVSDDKTIKIWNLQSKECINSLKTDVIQTCLGKFKNGQFMAGGEDGFIIIFNFEGIMPTSYIPAHSEPTEVIYMSPFTGNIISGSQDNLIKIFNTDNTTCIKILKGHNNTVLYVSQIDPNNILTISVDKTVKIWSIQ